MLISSNIIALLKEVVAYMNKALIISNSAKRGEERCILAFILYIIIGNLYIKERLIN